MKTTKTETLKIVVIGTGITGKNNVSHLLKNNSSYTTLTIVNPKNDYDDILHVLNDADIVFITTGLNDLSGMQVGSHLSKITKTINILTICVIPHSLNFNSKTESQNAKDRLFLLEQDFNAVISPGIEFLSEPIIAQSITKTLSNLAIYTIDVISGIVIGRGNNDINLDVEDLKVIMRGKVLVGSANFSGKNCAYKDMNGAIKSSLFENNILMAKGILVSFTMHPDFPLPELKNAMQFLEESAQENTDIIFGTTTDETLPIDYMQIIVMMSFYEDKHKIANNV